MTAGVESCDSEGENVAWRRWEWGCLVASLGILAWVAGLHWESLNTDAVAYVQLAAHYAEGRFKLAISGYWGPMISWLMVPVLMLGGSWQLAARSVMVLSGLVFVAGTLRLWRRLGLPPAWRVVGSVLGVAGATGWSVSAIAPDLLLSGWVALAVSELVSREWPVSKGGCVRAGWWWGLAYLTKAIALPLAVVSIPVIWAGWWYQTGRGRSMHQAAVGRVGLVRTLGVLAVVSLPWITVLSVTYGGVVFSTSGRIAHAVVGPGDGDRYHPFARTFHDPGVGRLTAWEDPSRMEYRYWSPFESRGAFEHQLRVIREHAMTELRLLGSLDGLLLGLVGVVVAAWRGFFRVERSLVDRAWMPGVVLVVLCGGYLPVYIKEVDQRYLVPVWGLSFGLASTAFWWWEVGSGEARRIVRLVGIGLVTISLGVPVLRSAGAVLTGGSDPVSRVAGELAGRMRAAGLRGPVAGSALLGGQRAGLFAAWLAHLPWVGDRMGAGAMDYLRSGARYVVVVRGSAVSQELASDARFEGLDSRLRLVGGEAGEFPLEVFEVRKGSDAVGADWGAR